MLDDYIYKILEHYPKKFRLLDCVLYPIMVLLNGFNGDSIQETHPWHGININTDQIPKNKRLMIKKDVTAKYENNDKSLIKRWLFHAPILGGWREYVVIKNKDFIDGVGWFVGWISDDANKNISLGQLHRLKIDVPVIKVLRGTKDVEFFAVNEERNVLSIEVSDFGMVGDRRYSGVRQF